MNTAMPLPLDVRLMNLTTSILATALVLGCLAAGLWWVMRNPAFAIGRITVEGDTTHNSSASLRANVAPRLAGNFFTLDLDAARAAFQSTPWVRKAMVQRVFPDQLNVTLQEHVPAAIWGEDNTHMVNAQGEVFEAVADDAEEEGLPRLLGPEGRASELLQMYRLLAPLLKPLGQPVEELALEARGNWRAELENGAVLELGQGSAEELKARLTQFASTVGDVAARHQRGVEAIEFADLRHISGYALRLRGVATGKPEPKPVRPKR
ncbi:cell division protein FtsQ/DivIB [Ottowia thiooxydans]|uniref:cell division protein FtsQ/DivIB n=1 Tax=Ottowia thiooxydans TaxID=219182 RepID=UPI000429CA49|nr:cell division protein FtsQ/DivIB [Ottowia thiooxydans]